MPTLKKLEPRFLRPKVRNMAVNAHLVLLQAENGSASGATTLTLAERITNKLIDVYIGNDDGEKAVHHSVAWGKHDTRFVTHEALAAFFSRFKEYGF